MDRSGFNEYYYWSERLAANLAGSHGPSKRTWTFGVNLGFLKLSMSSESASDDRTAKARLISKQLSDQVVTDLSFTQPVNYAGGTSPVVFSAIKSINRRDIGVMNAFIPISYTETGTDVAVCLFGSRTNVCGQDPEFPEWRGNGWTASTFMGLDSLLRATVDDVDPDTLNARVDDDDQDRDELCRFAYRLSYHQGDILGENPVRPWRRAYTLGHCRKAEWLAKIHYTATFSRARGRLHVLVGAPIWIRSTKPEAWVSYADPVTVKALEADDEPPTFLRL
ncbi:hypothetical protein AB0K52_21915 [Glycomyces sp. NPDC049804]|uniref:DUF7019 family protein n=1 Tax=Glycomyces sp. NPDC049804 TaxID=3154363 RepID=UPI0034194A89